MDNNLGLATSLHQDSYAISSPTSAEERKLDRRFAYANPTLVQCRQTDTDRLVVTQEMT
jgi:hypothetical protein